MLIYLSLTPISFKINPKIGNENLLILQLTFTLILGGKPLHVSKERRKI